jgi:UDP-glucuronate decarboxylase
MMDTPEGFTGPVNIGNPDEFTILQLASLAIEFAGGSSVLTFHPARPDDPVRRRPDISLARDRLKWEPQTALRAGLKVTMDHFRRELGLVSA